MASRVAAGADNFGLSIDDLLTAAKSGFLAPAAQAGPRARRRAMRSTFEGGGAIAAALAVAGCKTVSSGDPSVVPGGGDPGSQPGRDPITPAPPASSVYAVEESGAAPIDIGDMLAGQAGAQSIVSITGVENGVAVIKGSMVYFTPNEGFSGAASISFTYRDASGRLLSGRFNINVDDDAAHAQGHHSHTDGIPGDHGGDHDGHGGGDNGGTPGDGHSGHGGGDPAENPALMADHHATLALVPVGEATHVAVKNGSWFDPSTWANGQVPGDGAKVLIPEGVSVLYDGESSASIFTVRVDGALDFATDKDTFLEVDTFVVTNSGHLTIGTADHPVAAGVQAVISIADNGPIDVDWDPRLLSRGVVSMGDVQIYGAEKESFIRLAVDPMKGDTVLQLEEAPDGWRVGDKLVLAGTHWIETPKAAEGEIQQPATEDEELVITAIVGNKVYVDRPLQYDHEGARDDLKTYAANYTRNIRFETENPDTTPVHERGHVMFMHSDNVDVRYAEFYELGRTDKTEQSFDISDIDNVQSDSNVQGRYSLHLHRTGTADVDDPAMVVGNAVWGSPGWGYVHHDSNAIFAENAAYDVSGAAFVSELGTETGRWSDNIAIRTWGVSEHIKDADSVIGFDNGRTGVGFWFEGRMVDSVGNIAAGATEAGFIYMHRVPSNQYKIVDPSTSQQSDKLHYLDKAALDKPNISNFLDNEVIASATGLHVLKNTAGQGHDVRSLIENFTAWETRIGVHLEYTSHYTIKGLDVVGT
ncbi:MAG: G8 domain-containing protein, partial [Amphiplicatus sp.]